MSKKVEPLFEIINSLSYDKKSEYDFNLESEYNSWQINRGLSLYEDTIFFSNLMNTNPLTSKKMQHDFYFYGLRKRKRFSKWPKRVQSEDIEFIQNLYSYSKQDAIEAIKTLGPDKLESLRRDYQTGSVKK